MKRTIKLTLCYKVLTVLSCVAIAYSTSSVVASNAGKGCNDMVITNPVERQYMYSTAGCPASCQRISYDPGAQNCVDSNPEDYCSYCTKSQTGEGGVQQGCAEPGTRTIYPGDCVYFPGLGYACAEKPGAQGTSSPGNVPVACSSGIDCDWCNINNQ